MHRIKKKEIKKLEDLRNFKLKNSASFIEVVNLNKERRRGMTHTQSEVATIASCKHLAYFAMDAYIYIKNVATLCRTSYAITESTIVCGCVFVRMPQISVRPFSLYAPVKSANDFVVHASL